MAVQRGSLAGSAGRRAGAPVHIIRRLLGDAVAIDADYGEH